MEDQEARQRHVREVYGEPDLWTTIRKGKVQPDESGWLRSTTVDLLSSDKVAHLYGHATVEILASRLATLQRNPELEGRRVSPPFLDHRAVTPLARFIVPFNTLARGPFLGSLHPWLYCRTEKVTSLTRRGPERKFSRPFADQKKQSSCSPWPSVDIPVQINVNEPSRGPESIESSVRERCLP